jgi:RimJ/RimL family protein N-acetyltransferase
MEHSLQTEGYGIRLRPVRLDDAAFIVWLRNLDYVKGNVGDSALDAAGQEAWLKRYFAREGDYYFIAETPSGIPLGTQSVYDVQGNSGEQGRNIARPDVLAGFPGAMLMTDLAFEKLGLKELRSNAVATNVTVLSLHRKTGFKQVGVRRSAQIINGKPVDLVQFLLTVEDWREVRNRLLPLANHAGVQVLEWEKTQSGRRQPWDEDKSDAGC